jgi:NodT family efflux transporter outer membrane factor (OMF) lipoprotein
MGAAFKEKDHRIAFLRFGAGPLLCLLFSNCSIRDNGITGPEMPADFSGTGTQAIPDKWWKSFGDRELNTMEERALTSNFSLEATWQRLQQAEAVVERERSDLFPDLDALLDGEAGSGGGRSVSAGLAASYEIDFWGRIRSRVEAERLRSKASLASYRTAALTLSAEVARTWFQLVEARAQRDLIENQIDANEKVLRQLKVRLRQGQGRAVDILRQEQLVAATREQMTLVDSDIGVLKNRLAVLQGRAPQTGIAESRRSLPKLPPFPRTGLPAELIQRRPDVMEAFYLVQAADADLAAAISDRFPRINLTGFLTTSGGRGSSLFDDWLTSAAGSLIAPIIDGNERKSEVRRQRAIRKELLANYGQTVLVALREVEDSLVLERQQAAQITQLEKQLNLAERSYNQLLVEYFNGVSDYIDVLTSLTERQRLEREVLSAKRELIGVRVGLYRALAGGFKDKRR